MKKKKTRKIFNYIDVGKSDVEFLGVLPIPAQLFIFPYNRFLLNRQL